jgi:AAA15 family ATPase/GTPase
MIVSFSVGNYLSFKDKVSISFIPRPFKENEDDCVFESGYNDLRLLKGGVFIGANASGKSNTLKALKFMKEYVLNSHQLGPNEEINVQGFKLSNDLIGKPSFFEIVFIIDGVKYRYGFSVDNNKVRSEWLYYSIRKSDRIYFERVLNEYPQNVFRESQRFTSLIKENSLLLSVTAQNNGPVSLLIYKWFQDLTIIADNDYNGFLHSSAKKLQMNSPFKAYFKRLIDLADLGIEDFEIINTNLIDNNILKLLPENLRKQYKNTQHLLIKTIHPKFDSSGNKIDDISFDLENEESQGTIKYFALAGPIVDSLKEGKPLIIDELDSRLHPTLCSIIIKMFNSQLNNRNNSQLIFSTQNHNFFDEQILRRDQVFFVNKNVKGITTIDNTFITKKVRNDASFKKDYDLGKYGAKPKVQENQLGLFGNDF